MQFTSMKTLPTVTLDTTLSDLYKIGQNDEKVPTIALLACGYSSGMDLGPGMPRNKKYLFQEGITVSKTESECAKISPGKLREVSAKLFSLVPQRDSFGAGNMDTVFFTWDARRGMPPQTLMEATETFSNLPHHQRPRILSCSSPDDLSQLMEDHVIDALAEKIPIDGTETLGNVCNMSKWSYYNSKLAIHESRLPTPKTVVYEPEFCSVDPEECCEACSSYPFSTEVSEACTGLRKPWLKEQLNRFLSAVKSHPLPFVLKSQQGGGGGGTWIITTEVERQEFLQQADTAIARKIFASWTKRNKSMRPAVFLFMEYIRNERCNWGLTFFITRNGRPIFLSATEQKLINGKLWYGSRINYRDQSHLQKKFSSLMGKITNFVFHSQSPEDRYYGPIGADILETSPSGESIEPMDSRYLIVDLNVRIPGSLTLGLLKSHFTTSRTSSSDPPLPHAMNQFLELSVDRAALIQSFKKEFYETRAIVITAWYFDAIAKKSHAALVVAGRNEAELDELLERIRKFSTAFTLS